eukprot:XP_001700961.1 predicted protein [Chlamydomonas reinhardtii]
MRQRREEKPTFQPQPLVQKTLEYVQKFNCGTNPEAVQAMRNRRHASLARNASSGQDAGGTYAAVRVPDNPEDPPEEQRGLAGDELDRLLAEVQNLRHA